MTTQTDEGNMESTCDKKGRQGSTRLDLGGRERKAINKPGEEPKRGQEKGANKKRREVEKLEWRRWQLGTPFGKYQSIALRGSFVVESQMESNWVHIVSTTPVGWESGNALISLYEGNGQLGERANVI